MKDKNRYVTESPLEMFFSAELDIINIDKILDSNKHQEKYSFAEICYKASQATEKYLKGYLVKDRDDIPKTHDLEYLWKEVATKDREFYTIENDCDKLNNYTAGIRYSSQTSVERHEVIDVLKSLNTIHNFLPIKEMRGLLKQSDDEYKMVPDIDISDIIDAFSGKSPDCIT
jgi:HEPN domain-containing protein